MEYLTIKDYHRSHFRGMEPFKHNRYDDRGLSSIPRPLIPPSESRRSPPLSNSPGGEASSWPGNRTRGMFLLNTPHLPPPALQPTQSLSSPSISEPAVSLSSGSRPQEHLPTEPGEWSRHSQPSSTRSSGPPRQMLAEREESKAFKLPSFNSVSAADRFELLRDRTRTSLVFLR
jgi:hypothetical protein